MPYKELSIFLENARLTWNSLFRVHEHMEAKLELKFSSLLVSGHGPFGHDIIVKHTRTSCRTRVIVFPNQSVIFGLASSNENEARNHWQPSSSYVGFVVVIA